MKVLEHVYFECPRPCPETSVGNPCRFCDSGLVVCIVCGAAEGQLLTTCPGYALNYEARDACYQGNVIDFKHWMNMRDAGYDIRNRRWIR